MADALTRLALTKRLGQWSGSELPINITDTVTPDDDHVADLVAFVDQAWLDIQLSQHDRWLWMKGRLLDTVALTASDQFLPIATIDATARKVVPFLAHDTEPLRYILLTHPTDGSIHRCEFVPYAFFRGYRDRGTRPENKPTRFTIHPDQSLEFDPVPDVAYTIQCDYITLPTELALDADEPDMPNHFHMLVVWWAMVHLMDFEEKGGRYKTADRQYRILINRLNIEQLPDDLINEYLSTAEVYSW